MALAPDEAIIQVTYNTLANDSDLQTAFGGSVRIHGNYAPQDPELPYFVHRVETEKDGKGDRNGRYYLDWWDYSGSQSTVWDIENRVFLLLDEKRFITTEAGLVKVNNEVCNPVPESEPKIQHYHSRWSARYFAKHFVEQINAR